MGALFDILVALHVACAVVGFGSLALSGVYGFGTGRRRGARDLEEARRYFAAPGRLEFLILVVPFIGAAALIVQPGGRGLAQLWAGLAAAVWLVAAVALIRVIRPAELRVREALAAGEVEDAARAARRVGWGATVTDLAFVVALGLMVFQPR